MLAVLRRLARQRLTVHKTLRLSNKGRHIRSQSADDEPWRAGASFVTSRARERARDGGERRSGRGVIGSNYESSAVLNLYDGKD